MPAPEMPQSRSAVVLVVDRLGAGHLGPYGNAWLPTPHVNRLASESVLFETCLADSPALAATYRAWWTGRHTLAQDHEVPAGVAAKTSLPNLARERGLSAILITDDPEVAQLPLAQHFDEHLVLNTPPASQCAEAVEETGLFQLVAATIEVLAERPRPIFAWIHARGMSAAWDAPYELRAAMADLDDPDPPRLIVPPEERLAPGFDPDAVLGIAQAYSGQVQLFDECLGHLLAALQDHPQAGNLLFALTSPRGYPLGEHGRIGPCDHALYNELIHVPLLMRFPRTAGGEYPQRLSRVQSLAQPADLWGELAGACQWSAVADERAAGSSVAAIVGPNQRAIRTPAWYLRESQSAAGPERELYAKPDDRWEANEVASRCGDVVERLAAQLDAVEQALRQGTAASLPPLPADLTDVWR
jgi:arylsulfatase A-like enzyme